MRPCGLWPAQGRCELGGALAQLTEQGEGSPEARLLSSRDSARPGLRATEAKTSDLSLFATSTHSSLSATWAKETFPQEEGPISQLF